MERGMTPNELARYWRCSPDKIRAWINSGKLQAINTATKGKRPRFVILPRHIEAFEKSLEVQPPAPPDESERKKRQRKKELLKNITRYSDAW